MCGPESSHDKGVLMVRPGADLVSKSKVNHGGGRNKPAG